MPKCSCCCFIWALCSPRRVFRCSTLVWHSWSCACAGSSSRTLFSSSQHLFFNVASVSISSCKHPRAFSALPSFCLHSSNSSSRSCTFLACLAFLSASLHFTFRYSCSLLSWQRSVWKSLAILLSVSSLFSNTLTLCLSTSTSSPVGARVASEIGLPFLAITGVSSQRAAAGDAKPSYAGRLVAGREGVNGGAGLV